MYGTDPFFGRNLPDIYRSKGSLWFLRILRILQHRQLFERRLLDLLDSADRTGGSAANGLELISLSG